MRRSVLVGALLLGIGALAGALLLARGAPDEIRSDRAPIPSYTSARRGFGREPAASDDSKSFVGWERRLDRLAAEVEREAGERRRLQRKIEEIASDLAALRHEIPGSTGAEATASRPSLPAASASAGQDIPSARAVEEQPLDDGRTATERALIAAGVDESTAAEIRRHEDELALDEVYLRDQATREQWLDSPRFAAEMAEIRRQRLSIREEIGDDAYDRYLAALGRPNRVRVDDVMLGSVAADAGLQSGDVVLRYGGARIFAPGDLVDETHGGTEGETVSVEVLRQGERIELTVPRGPLGVRIAASSGSPGDG